MSTINGSSEPDSSLASFTARQSVRYLENPSQAAPPNNNPGCQHSAEHMPNNPHRNGRSRFNANRLRSPNRIIGVFGWMPPLLYRANAMHEIITAAEMMPMRLSRYSLAS